jgi:hypothetical protein
MKKHPVAGAPGIAIYFRPPDWAAGGEDCARNSI